MNYYIFRNFTCERLFENLSPTYGDYGDVFKFEDNYNNYIWFYHPPLKTNIEEIVNEINDYTDKLEIILSKIHKSKTLILFQLDINLFFKYFESDYRLENSLNLYNQKCIELGNQNRNIKVISLSNFTKNYTITELIDWKYYYISQMYINPKLSKNFQSWFGNKLNAINSKRKKCIVLDLDNTLWGGVLGEDGINGVQLGNTYPGLAYQEFQQNLLNASKHGIILAVCSKNNEADVFEFWSINANNKLKVNNFSSLRINWNSKVDNIQEIANELNIGLDSIVFIDDNPIEREAVKTYLPDVCVPDFPQHPYLLQEFFENFYNTYFNTYVITEEDSNKTKQYLENNLRENDKKSFSNFDEYLEKLNIEINIQTPNETNLARIAQLTQKTNQFNLTTNRYTESDIGVLIKNNSQIKCALVKDKFGDNGITILSIITFAEPSVAKVDTFLLSCRILGRGIEIAYFKYILNMLLESGIKRIEATYKPTLKNKQVENFYNQFGFQLLTEMENGQKNYYLENPAKFEIKDYYKITE